MSWFCLHFCLLTPTLRASQAVSLLLVPLFWTLPRIVELQATVPAAVCEGACSVLYPHGLIA